MRGDGTQPHRLFGNSLQGRFVSLIFGNGIFALRGVVIDVHVDYLTVEEEKDHSIVHVPLASIVYAKLGVKRDV